MTLLARLLRVLLKEARNLASACGTVVFFP